MNNFIAESTSLIITPMEIDAIAIKKRIRKYIQQTVHVDSDKIQNDSLIFREGYVDSIGFIMLVTFLEEEFNIKTVDSDLIEENFESINAISGFVKTKSGG